MMSKQVRLLVGTGLLQLGSGTQASPAALSWGGGDPLAPVFPRSPWGMLDCMTFPTPALQSCLSILGRVIFY